MTLFYTNQDTADICQEKSIDDCTNWKTKRANEEVVSDKGLSTECGKHTCHQITINFNSNLLDLSTFIIINLFILIFHNRKTKENFW